MKMASYFLTSSLCNRKIKDVLRKAENICKVVGLLASGVIATVRERPWQRGRCSVLMVNASETSGRVRDLGLGVSVAFFGKNHFIATLSTQPGVKNRYRRSVRIISQNTG